jgi:hypothetical protein
VVVGGVRVTSVPHESDGGLGLWCPAPGCRFIDRELQVTLTAVDVNGCRIVYTHTWTPFAPLFEPLTLVTGLTHHGGQGVRAEVVITDPLGEARQAQR